MEKSYFIVDGTVFDIFILADTENSRIVAKVFKPSAFQTIKINYFFSQPVKLVKNTVYLLKLNYLIHSLYIFLHMSKSKHNAVVCYHVHLQC